MSLSNVGFDPTEVSTTAVPPRAPKGAVLRTLVRSGVTTAVLVTLYYVLPLDRQLTVGVDLLLAAGLAAFVALITFQLRDIVRAPYPRLRAIQAIATSLPIFLLLFAVTYYLAARADAGFFTQPLSRTDSLYFTVTVFSTVGFGDITPKAEAARLLVVVQMLGDLAFIGLIGRAVVGAVTEGLRRQGGGTGSP